MVINHQWLYKIAGDLPLNMDGLSCRFSWICRRLRVLPAVGSMLVTDVHAAPRHQRFTGGTQVAGDWKVAVPNPEGTQPLKVHIRSE